MATFYEHNKLREQDVQYEKYEGIIGDTFLTDYEEERHPLVFHFCGKPADWVAMLSAKPVDPGVYEIEQWECEGAVGMLMFQDPYIRLNVQPTPKFHLWHLLLQQRGKKEKKKEPLQHSAQERCYEYFFSTVDKGSIHLYEGGKGQELISEGVRYRVQYNLQASGVRVRCPETLTDLLYDLELGKARAYLQTYGKMQIYDDWLYSLAMYDRHKEDYIRVLRLIPASYRVLSYGDRVAQLRSRNKDTTYVDLSPSKFALATVKKPSLALLRQAASDPDTAIVLMYVWYGLNFDERHILLNSKALVIKWDEKDLSPYAYSSHGVSSNRPLPSTVVPTERNLKIEVPWNINFSLYKGHVFLDTGIMLDYVVRALFPRVLRFYDPSFTQYQAIPVIKDIIQEGEVYVAHDFATVVTYHHLSPYFVPIGRKVGRFITVSSPRQMYRVRTIYAFEGERAYLETTLPSFVKLLQKTNSIIGYFSYETMGPGFSIVGIEAEVENCYVAVEKRGTRVDIGDRFFFLKNATINEDLDFMMSSLSRPEKKAVWTTSKYHVCAPALVRALARWAAANDEKMDNFG